MIPQFNPCLLVLLVLRPREQIHAHQVDWRLNQCKCVSERLVSCDGLGACPECISACHTNTAGIHLGTTADPDPEQMVNNKWMD